MSKEVRDILRIRYKMLILELAKKSGNVSKTCRNFDVTKSSFYKWKKAYDIEGKEGLKRKNLLHLIIPKRYPKRVLTESLN
jgi:transposase-like protein